MTRHESIRYAVYYNIPNPHVKIHDLSVHQNPERHGGNHKYAQGGWGYFVTTEEAKVFAEAISKSKTKNLPIEPCMICQRGLAPDSHSG